MTIYTLITILCWVIFFTYWYLKAQKVKKEVYSQTKLSRYIYLFFLFGSLFVAYLPFTSAGFLGYKIIPQNTVSGILGTLTSLAGVAFAIWARSTLGANWSAKVTLKKEHELVQSGPYRIVRHPIYTGFEMVLLGGAITVGEVKGVFALGIVFICHITKIKMEEELMHKQFHAQYDEYAKRVKRLIPYVY